MFRIFLLASSVNDEHMLMRQKMLTMICLLLGINLCYLIEFIMVGQRCDRGWNRTNVPIDINPFITHPAHERLYHTTRLYAPYSLLTEVWVLLRSTRIRTVKELWDAYSFSSWYEKTRTRHHHTVDKWNQA